jgi:ribonuclease VapC
VKKKSVLDSFAILAWLQNESGADRVEALLTQAQRRKTFLLLNVINLGEVYYRLARQHGHPLAHTIIRQLETVPITLYPCDHDLAIEAAQIKADYPMAYADAFTVATALKEDAVVITGDPEFHQVEHLVTIDWI